MAQNSLRWCFKLKDGLRVTEPNERLAKSYLEEAKLSLARAQKNFEDKDLLWTTVVLYYSEYYSLYSFLQRIGVKCENHLCSIIAAGFLLGESKIKVIMEHKDKRVDAQYYMKIGKENEVMQMLLDAKLFVSMFEEITLSISQEEIKDCRDKLKRGLP